MKSVQRTGCVSMYKLQFEQRLSYQSFQILHMMRVSFSLETGEWCRGSYGDQQLTHFLVDAIPICLLVSHVTAERQRKTKYIAC